MEFDVVNPDDADIVLDEVVVVVSPTDVIVDDAICDDLDVVVVAIVDVSELLVVNDNVSGVGVDHLGDAVC